MKLCKVPIFSEGHQILFDVIWFQLLYKCWRLVLVFGVVWAVVINLMALMAAVRIAGFSIA